MGLDDHYVAVRFPCWLTDIQPANKVRGAQSPFTVTINGTPIEVWETLIIIFLNSYEE